jgi:hypothetical protein
VSGVPELAVDCMLTYLGPLPLSRLDLEYVQLDVDQILALLNKTFTKVRLLWRDMSRMLLVLLTRVPLLLQRKW